MRAGTLLFAALTALPWVSAQSAGASPSTCIAAFATPIPKGYTCGKAGNIAKKILPIGTAVSADHSLSCGIVCQDNPACQTFSYNAKTKACTQYKLPLNQIGFVLNATSPVQYWNVHCIGCAPPSAITTTSTTHSSTPAATATNHARCATTTFTASTQKYQRYYMGAGYIASPNNPGNDNSAEPAIITEMSGSYLNDCAAIQACSNLAASQSMIYYSFDVHWWSNTKTWECVQYYDPNKNASWFNVKNKQAYVSYGFYNPDY